MSAIFRIHGDFSAKVRVGEPFSESTVHVFRDVTIEKDGGTWAVYVFRPEEGDANRQYPNEYQNGSIYVYDPVVNAFLDQMAALIANPDAFHPGLKVGTYEPAETVKGEAR